MERNNILVTTRDKKDFSDKTLFQDLNTLIKFKKGQQQNSQSLPETNLKVAMLATAALIKFLDVSSIN